jgi:pyruvate kinase
MLERGRTKIVCTIGPASREPEVIRGMLRGGMAVARLNFSHGSAADFRLWVDTLRSVARQEREPLALLQDLSGPKVRIGTFAAGKVFLRPDDPFRLTTAAVAGDAKQVSVPLPQLCELASGVKRLLLADGMIELEVQSVGAGFVDTRVSVGGWLSDRKGIAFPGQKLPIEALTEKDLRDLKLGLELGVDYVALSFVRSHLDVRQLRKLIHEAGGRQQIISKLERPEALEDLDGILRASDGVMVARGDLGIEMPPEKVPLAQKRIIEAARHHSKYVITATQMLESMIHSAWPTRAEASDVANAVLDGTDAVMLSGESATGDHPVRVVEMMQRIIVETENAGIKKRDRRRDSSLHFNSVAGSLSWAASELAEMNSAKAIVAFSQSGATARLIAKTQPAVPLIGLSPDPMVVRQMNLGRGVRPYQTQLALGLDGMATEVERSLREQGLADTGDLVVITAGYPAGPPWRTNFLKLHRLGDLDAPAAADTV